MKRIIFLIIIVFSFSPFLSQAEDATTPVRVLLVPGHDNKIWGAQYGNIKEADMNLVLATQIYDILKKDKRFEVYITRDKSGFTKEFADYFSNEKEEIISFKQNAKKETKAKIADGTFISRTTVSHIAISEETAIKLYGTNKWANENDIDLIINVHFNDYPRPSKWTIGEYKGFVIYIPDRQMLNAGESLRIAKSVFSELSKKYITSTYLKEKEGLIPDQKLIALGASGTLDQKVNSILIEYGYIYQKIFRDRTTRHQAYKDMALLTTNGIVNHYFKK